MREEGEGEVERLQPNDPPIPSTLTQQGRADAAQGDAHVHPVQEGALIGEEGFRLRAAEGGGHWGVGGRGQESKGVRRERCSCQGRARGEMQKRAGGSAAPMEGARASLRDVPCWVRRGGCVGPGHGRACVVRVGTACAWSRERERSEEGGTNRLAF
jgi:hypothetical protein